MSDFKQTWAQVEQDPRYKQLSYQEQLQVRSGLLRKYLPEDQRFQQLLPYQRAQVFQELSYVAPTVPMEERTPTYDRFMTLAEGVNANDPEALEAAMEQYRSSSVYTNTPWTVRAMDVALDVLGFATGGMTDRLLEENIYENADQITQGIIPSNDAERAAFDYLEHSLANNPATAAKVSRTATFATLGGVLTDITTSRLLMGIGPTALTPISTGKDAFGIYNTLRASATTNTLIHSPAMRMVFGSMAPFAADAARDAAVGVAREAIRAEYEGRPWSEIGFGEASAKAARTFGEWFIGDIIFFSAAKTLKHIVKGGQLIFRRGGLRGHKGDVIRRFLNAAPEEQTADIERMFRGENEELWAALDQIPEAKAQVGRAQAVRELTRQLGKLSPESDEFMTVMGAAKNLDLQRMDDGLWRVSKMTEDLELGKGFQTSREALTHGMRRIIDESVAVADDVGKQAAKVSRAPKLFLRERVRGNLTKSKLMKAVDEATINRFAPDDAGVVRQADVEAGFQSLLRKAGVPNSKARRYKVVGTDSGKWIRNTETGKDVVRLPNKINAPKGHVDFLGRVIRTAGEEAEALTGKPVRQAFRDVANVGKQLRKGRFSPGWIDMEAKRQFGRAALKRGKEGTFILNTPEGARTFGDLDEVGAFLYQSRGLRLDEVQASLRREHGLELRAAEDGTLSLRYFDGKEGGRILRGQYKTVEEFLAKNPDLTPKRPVGEMPDFLVIDNTKGRVEVEGQVVSGPADQLIDWTQNYTTFKKADEVKVVGRGADDQVIEMQVKKRTYIVEAPEVGFKKEFRSLKQAREFLQKSKETYEMIETIGFEKGARITPGRGGFIVQSTQRPGKYIFAADFDGLKRVIDDLPQDEAIGKELTGLSEAYVKSVTDPYVEMQPLEHGVPSFLSTADFTQYLKKSKNYGKGVRASTSIQHIYKPMDSWFKKVATEIGDDGIYQNIFRGVAKQADVYRGFTRAAEDGLDTIMKGTTKKQRVLYTELLQKPAEDWEAAAKALGWDLTQPDITTMNNIRTFLNEASRTFGVDTWKFLQDYLPRIRSFAKESLGELSSNASVREYFQKMMGTHSLPKEMDWFADHLRTRDLMEFAEETDVLELLKSYISGGYKKLVLGPAYDAAKRYFNEAESIKKLPFAVQNRMAEFLEEVMGITNDTMAEGMQQASRQVTKRFADGLAKLGVLDEKRAARLVKDDLIGYMQGFTVSATMAMRPFLPIRNMMQIWTTLAPRVGIATVADALERVVQNPEAIMRRLYESGRVRGKIPIFGYNDASPLAAFNRWAMGAYMNSDDFTRAVVDQVVAIEFDDAVRRFEAGSINEKQFIKMSGIRHLDYQDQAIVVQRLQQEGVVAARDELATQLTRETMFPYRGFENPTVFKGLRGRIFGMFGHYPVFFRENVMRAISNKSLAEIGAFAARWTATTYVLFSVFQDLFGVSAMNFHPLGQMVFTGGPYYELINEALNAFDPYEIQRRGFDNVMTGVLDRAEQVLVPGSVMRRSFFEGVEMLRQGDRHEAILRMMSFPMVRED